MFVKTYVKVSEKIAPRKSTEDVFGIPCEPVCIESHSAIRPSIQSLLRLYVKPKGSGPMFNKAVQILFLFEVSPPHGERILSASTISFHEACIWISDAQCGPVDFLQVWTRKRAGRSDTGILLLESCFIVSQDWCTAAARCQKAELFPKLKSAKCIRWFWSTERYAFPFMFLCTKRTEDDVSEGEIGMNHWMSLFCVSYTYDLFSALRISCW